MNLRHFSIAVLVSALPIFAFAESHGISLVASDFISAEKSLKNGETIVSVKLSKSGRSKFKKLKAQIPTHVHSDVGGVATDFQLKQEITDSGVEMGPYTDSDAAKVIAEINGAAKRRAPSNRNRIPLKVFGRGNVDVASQ